MSLGWMSNVRRVVSLRWLRPDRNPLRRTADWVEAALLVALLVVFVAGAPLAAVTSGGWAAAAASTAQRVEAGWRAVPATLAQRAPASAPAMFQVPPEVAVWARWTAPDGTPRTGRVFAPAGTPAGRVVTVWTNRGGRVTGYPARTLNVVEQAVLTGLLAVVGLTAALAATWLAVRRLLDRHRLASWDISWAAVGPRWTGRH
jgi:hypothetical protein